MIINDQKMMINDVEMTINHKKKTINDVKTIINCLFDQGGVPLTYPPVPFTLPEPILRLVLMLDQNYRKSFSGRRQ